jgi:hypothetical protein
LGLSAAHRPPALTSSVVIAKKTAFVNIDAPPH